MNGADSMELISLLDLGVARDRAAPCLETADGSRSFTYGEVYELTHRLALGLRRLGARAGTPIGVISPNDPLAFIAVLAVLRLGATWIPLNARSGSEELAELLELCRCPLVLCHEDLDAVGERVATNDREVVSLGDGNPKNAKFRSLLVDAGERLSRRPAAEQLAALAGTGGTTGRPKVVMLGHRQLYMQSLGLMVHMAEPTPPVQIAAAPMTHTAGSITFPVLAAGGKTIVHDGVVADDVLAAIERQGATRLFLPPTAIYSLLESPALGKHDLSSLEHFLYLAAPMSESKLEEALEAFGPVMCQSFGQSEAPTICTWFSREDHAGALASASLRQRLRSCGRQSVVAEVGVMGDDDELLEPGAQGELVIRGPLVMQGYLDDPEASDASRRSGWHATGDVGYRDADGFIYIVDRIKDLIISGGFNVYPGEVERVLLLHPAVRECAVIGTPDRKWGEAVTAVVEMRDGEAVDEGELRSYCRERLGPVKTPKRVLFDTLPRSAFGKVVKRQVRESFWVGHDRKI